MKIKYADKNYTNTVLQKILFHSFTIRHFHSTWYFTTKSSCSVHLYQSSFILIDTVCCATLTSDFRNTKLFTSLLYTVRQYSYSDHLKDVCLIFNSNKTQKVTCAIRRKYLELQISLPRIKCKVYTYYIHVEILMNENN